MLGTLRAPLALLAGYGSGGHLPAFSAVEQLAKETNAGGGIGGAEPATSLETAPRPMVTGPFSYGRGDHLPSKPWYVYEYPDRRPKLPERAEPAYVLEDEQ
jgi:hypothetical protein